MEAIWLLVGMVLGLFAGAGVMLLVERLRGAAAESAEVAHLRAQLDAAQTVAGAREELLALVKHGAGEEFAQRGGEVVNLLKAQLETTLAEAGADNDARKRAVAELVDPMKRTLDELKQRLDQVDRAREQTSTDLTAKLQTVSAGQEVVARNAAALERALRQPHVQGALG